jgi:DNA polymerase-3 subunit gamma/tau
MELVGGGSARSTGAKATTGSSNQPANGANPEGGSLTGRDLQGKAGSPHPEEEGPQGGAKLLVETPVREQLPAQTPGQTTPPAATGSTSLGSLSKIRQQFSNRQQTDEANNRKPLEPDMLQKVWQEYADQLRENKNPAVQSLEMATLRILDPNTFEVVSSNNLEQKFIEQEKRTLSDHIQKAFFNKTISFAVIIEERVNTDEPAERPLNKREQFFQIIEQYPLVKELKDRLKLELDY